MSNYLSLLGWHPKRRDEVFRVEEVIQDFDPADLSNASARYDQKKWAHVASSHLQARTADELVRTGQTVPLGRGGSTTTDPVTLERAVETTRTRATTLVEVASQARELLARDRSFGRRPRVAFAGLAPGGPRRAQATGGRLRRRLVGRRLCRVHSRAVGADTGVKGKDLYHPIRLALTGTHSGPDMVSVAAILGKEEVTRRLDRCII